MAYTPINWQTGDTITAEKLNKMDRGWGYVTGDPTELFSETVTTSGSGMYKAELAYSQVIDASTITVTFDGTEYVCPRIDAFNSYFYGGFTEQGPVFTEYPFLLTFSVSSGNEVYTETASTHTIAVVAALTSMETSADFAEAVKDVAQPIVDDAIANIAAPLIVTTGKTTWNDVNSALKSGRPAFVWKHSDATGSSDTFEPVLTASYSGFTVSVLVSYNQNVAVKTYSASTADGALS